MCEYKLSKFNYLLNIVPNEYVIYNSLSKQICKFNHEQFEYYKNFAEHGNFNMPNNIKENCIKNGFFVLIDWDEDKIADFKHLEDIMDSRLDLIIMPTEQCNFRCKYCYEEFKKGKMTPNVQEGLVKYIKKNIYKHTALSVSWFGGEPLIATDVIENLSQKFIEICHMRSISYTSGMTTNGYNLTPEVLQTLLKYRVNTIQVTLDGNEQNHNRLKVLQNGMPTFKRVMDNLKYIRDYCDKQTINITIRTNVSFDLLDCLDEVIYMYSKEFGSDKRFSFFFRPVGDWGGDSVKELGQSVFKKEDYYKVYDKIAHSGIQLNYKLYNAELTKNIDVCYAARRHSYVVGSDGIVYKCSTIFNEPINRVGALLDNGKIIFDIDKIAKWTMLSVEKNENCSNCSIFGACHNSACIADQVRGKSEINCPHIKGNLDSILYILSQDINYSKNIIEE